MAAFFKIVMIIIEVLCGFLLVGVILLQRTKSQGLGGMAFGASIGESVFGSRAGNVLTKATIILGCVFLANTLFLALSYTRAAPQGVQSKSVMERRGVMPTPQQQAPSAQPTQPTAPATTPAVMPTPTTATPVPTATGPAVPATPAATPAAVPAAK